MFRGFKLGPCADLEAAEHRLVGREDSEILTQAAVDAMQPGRSIMARRPSVVQFAGLAGPAAAAAAAVDPAAAAVDPAAAAVAPGQLTSGAEAANTRFKVLSFLETYFASQKGIRIGTCWNREARTPHTAPHFLSTI